MEEHEEIKETQKKRKFNTKNLTEKIRKNPWMLATVLLSVFCLTLLIISFSGNLTGKVISGKEAGQKLLDFYTSAGIEGLKLESIKEFSGLYQINFEYQGSVIPFYVTKDGKSFVPGDYLTNLDVEESETETIPNKTIQECATEYEVEEEIIFYYSDSCGWCAKMKPGVEELEKDGYKFKWIEASDSENSDVINNCIKEHMTSSGVPQFICVKTGEIHVGAFADQDANLDQTALKSWVDECLSAN
jgi:hypothetical protein